RFYHALQSQVGSLAESVPPSVDRSDAQAVSLLYVSRLLFLCFLEAKGWLNANRAFISEHFDDCMRAGGNFHRRVLLPLFFGTLNTPLRQRAVVARAFGCVPFLNGGLFTRTALERRVGTWKFHDERLGTLLDRLAELRRPRGESGSVAAIRRDVLARSIFGVDLNPTAVWLCELRLWLSVVIESDESDPLLVPALPNLDRNIRTGDALVGSAFTRDPSVMIGGPRVVALRQRYVGATGPRKQSLARSLDREERRRVLSQTEREIRYAQFARGELLAAQ